MGSSCQVFGLATRALDGTQGWGASHKLPQINKLSNATYCGGRKQRCCHDTLVVQQSYCAVVIASGAKAISYFGQKIYDTKTVPPIQAAVSRSDLRSRRVLE